MKDREDNSKASSGAIVKFITFALGREKFGISLDEVKEIIADYNIVPLPRTPDFIEGIISLRGDIIPVVDMRARFEMESRESDDETRVIVLEMKDFIVGIQVDNVYEVLKLTEDAIEPPPKLVGGLKGDYIDGVAEAKGKLTIILNLDEIFSATEKIAMKEGLEIGNERTPEVPEKVDNYLPDSGESDVSLSCNVSRSGQISIRGESYYIGKKYGGNSVTVKEDDAGIAVYLDGEKIKEFKR